MGELTPIAMARIDAIEGFVRGASLTMAMQQVTGYQVNLDPTNGHHYINLYRHNLQVGRIETTDASHVHTTVDLLRNEGPNLYWNDTAKILHVGLEPVGEGE